MRRRSILIRWLFLTAFALPLSMGAARAQDTGQTRLLVGYSTGSVTALVAELIHPVLEEVLDDWVVVHAVPGARGIEATRALRDADPDGRTLLVADNLSLAVNDVAGTGVAAAELTPVAKVTVGISVALVTRDRGEIEDWAALVEKASSQPVSMSVTGRNSAYGIAWSMMERGAGLAFVSSIRNGDDLILADVIDGRTDVGLVTTNSIPVFNDRSNVKLRPLVTFGAARSTLFPDVPVFAEHTGDDKDDFTYSFAIFGPPGMDAETVARLATAIRTAIEDDRTQTLAISKNIPLQFFDAETVQETLGRDRSVALRLREFLQTE